MTDSPYPHRIILSASLAQLVEQLPLKEMVGGSNPSRGNERSELTSEGFEGRKKIFVLQKFYEAGSRKIA